MIEALIVITVMTSIFGLMTAVHHSAVEDLNALQAARAAAWQRALAGCPSDGFSLRDLISGVANGDLPLPDAYLPNDFATGSESRRIEGGVGRAAIQVTRSVRIPCNATPASAQGSLEDWVFQLFGG